MRKGRDAAIRRKPNSKTRAVDSASLPTPHGKKIRDWKSFPKVVKYDTTCEEWLALIQLIKKSWFERRWVVQEIVLAGEAEMRCGSQMMKWTAFSEALAFFELMEYRVKKKFRRNKDLDNPPDVFGEFKEFSANRLVKVTSNVVRRREDGRIEKRTEALETLVSSLTPFVSGEPKDSVYAILSLANDIKATASEVNLDYHKLPKDAVEKLLRELNITADAEKERAKQVLGRIRRRMPFDRFPVDYNKRFDQVCEDLYKFITFHSNSLDMICRPWCPDLSAVDEENRPSWVRSVRYRAHYVEHSNVERRNADTPVGPPGRSPYRADGRYRGEWHFERDGLQDLSSPGVLMLSACGFFYDKVSRVENVAEGGVVPEGWLSYRNDPSQQSQGSGLDSQQSRGVSDPFWQTMVAGRGPDGEHPSRTYSLVCDYIFNTNHAINLESNRKNSTNLISTQVYNRILSVIWGRRLARTRYGRRLALLPKDTKKNDVICILYGCSVPLVLRKMTEKTQGIKQNGHWEKGAEEGQDVWRLIGECYVYGMMGGEALPARREAWMKADADCNERLKDFYTDRRIFKIR